MGTLKFCKELPIRVASASRWLRFIPRSAVKSRVKALNQVYKGQHHQPTSSIFDSTTSLKPKPEQQHTTNNMKFTSLAYLLAAAAMGSAAVLAPAPAPRAPSADGLYIETTDAAGNTKVDFTPHHEVVNSTAFHTADVLQRSAVEKRREGCHASARVPSSVTDEANRLLLAQYPTSQVRIDGRARASVCF